MRVGGSGSGNAAELGGMLVRLTVVPPGEGALAFKVTVPVTICPELAFNGFILKVREVTAGGLIVSVLTLRLPLIEAEIVAGVWTDTGLDPTVKDMLVLPAGTVTVRGTVALLLVLERFTVVPPAGAGPPSVTVPVAC